MSGMVSAQHILVEQEFEAQDLVKKIGAGESFESLAMDFSKCPSGKSGGSLGTFGRGQMVKPFEDATYGLEVGQVSGPVKTQFGYHLIKRLS
jgi:peptidyl-prolyl cis-trans isomerase C